MKKRSSKDSTKNDLDLLLKVLLAVEGCRKDEDVDRISELPNDILVSILSLLTFREATATKILSSKWTRLDPIANVVSLGFPSPLKRQESYYGGYFHSSRENKISDYISQTNHTLDSYEDGKSITKFKIDIPCVKGDHWKKWLEFALSRETEILDIGIICKWSSDKWNDGVSPLNEIDSTLEKSRNTFSGLKYLKVLSLSEFGFNYSSDVLTNLISKFDVLERLSIESPRTLPDVICLCGIHGDSVSKLKYFNISNIPKVFYIFIHDMMNLVSLRCHGLELYYLDLYNLPKLVVSSIVRARLVRYGGFFYGFPFDNIYEKLLRLRLYIRLNRVKVRRRSYLFPTFTKLKHMELDIVIDVDRDKRPLFSLIRTCPSLEELEIKFLRSSKITLKKRMDKKLIGREAALGKLKTVRLSGYLGSVFELEFVLYVVNNNATNLKDLIIVEDGLKNHAAIRPKKFMTRVYEHLRSVIPTSVNFIS